MRGQTCALVCWSICVLLCVYLCICLQGRFLTGLFDLIDPVSAAYVFKAVLLLLPGCSTSLILIQLRTRVQRRGAAVVLELTELESGDAGDLCTTPIAQAAVIEAFQLPLKAVE